MSPRTRKLVQYVLPTILSQVSFFLFTIIDGIFVGQGIGTDALGAINIVFPFVMLCNALFMLATIGGVTVTAIRLGRGDTEGANLAFRHGMMFTVLFAVVLSCLGFFGADPLCRIMGSNETYHAMMRDYLHVYALFIIPSGLGQALNGFARNDGSPLLASGAVIVGTILNIIGDWLFVFPLRMGLAGAAWATGISQSVSMLICLTHFLRRKGCLRFGRFRPSGALCRKILLRGSPEAISQFATPVATLWTNRALMAQVGSVGVNAFGVICYVASFSVAIFYGAAQGLQPLFGQSYGAKKENDLKFYFRSGMLICLNGSALITLLLCLGCGGICGLFGTDAQTLEFTVWALPQYAWGFIVMALNTMISSYLYSTKRSRQAILINTLRSFVVDTLVILLLPTLFGPRIIWYTFGIYEGLVLIVAWILLKRSERNGIFPAA